MCAKVASDFGVDEMQRDLLSAVATVVMNERAFANGDRASIQPETDNTVFDLGVRIIDKNLLVESDSR
jgi:hypothetical protein